MPQETHPTCHPDVLVPSLRENTVGAVFVGWPLPLVTFTAWACARFQYGVDEAGEHAVAQHDHMSDTLSGCK